MKNGLTTILLCTFGVGSLAVGATVGWEYGAGTAIIGLIVINAIGVYLARHSAS